MCAVVWLVVPVRALQTVQFEVVRPRLVLGLAALFVAAIGLPVVALVGSIDGPAMSTVQAQRIAPVASDVVSVYNSGELRPDVANAAVAAARQAGATIAFGRSASVGMVRGMASSPLMPPSWL